MVDELLRWPKMPGRLRSSVTESANRAWPPGFESYLGGVAAQLDYVDTFTPPTGGFGGTAPRQLHAYSRRRQSS